MREQRATSTGDRLVQLLGLAAVTVLSVGIYMAFVYAPTDVDQGDAQRIFYVHVPMAWLAYLAMAVVLVGSVGYIWKRSERMDRLARSCDRDQGARYAAVLGVIGAIDVPIIHQSVKWWRTLHPEPIVLDTAGPNLPDSMLATLLVCLAGFTLLYAYLMVQKTRVETARDLLAERELATLLEPAAPVLLDRQAAPIGRETRPVAED
jgi:heme exporter protein C